jgi:microtubule-associated protein, RP/EB family
MSRILNITGIHTCFQVIPVERLIQCKFQDNLEFLQWMKKYWDSYYPGGKYDAPSRRKGKVAGGPVARKPAASPVAQPTMKKTLSNPSGVYAF